MVILQSMGRARTSLFAQLKLAFVFCFALFATQLKAQLSFAPVPTDLSYKTAGRGLLETNEVREVAALAGYLVSVGLKELDPNAGNGEAVFGVDQVFWNPESDQSLLLKLDVAPTAPNLEDRVLTDQESFLYHGATPSGLSYAIYMNRFSPHQARETVEGIQRAFQLAAANRYTQQIFQALRHLDPISSACAGAQTVSEELAGHGYGLQTATAERSSSANPATFGQKVMACTKGVGTGVYDSTVGLAVKVGKGAIKVVKATAWSLAHPIQAWKKFTAGIKAFFDMIKKAFGFYSYDMGIGRKKDKLSGLQQGVQESKQGPQVETEPPVARARGLSAYEKLSPVDKVKFVCNMSTKVGIAGLSWFFATANGAALSAEVASFFKVAATVATVELGRTLFMEVQYNKVADNLEAKRRQLSEEQIELSRKWARENPEEAQRILNHYKVNTSQAS